MAEPMGLIVMVVAAVAAVAAEVLRAIEREETPAEEPACEASVETR